MSCAACAQHGLGEHDACMWCGKVCCPFSEHRCSHGVECLASVDITALIRGREKTIDRLKCAECDAGWRARGCPEP